MGIAPLLAYFQANYNPATGFPFPIDLIDESVSLPRKFTKEFVEEIEALLIQDEELDKIDLSNYFAYLNPQKVILLSGSVVIYIYRVGCGFRDSTQKQEFQSNSSCQFTSFVH